jgi:Ca2+-transporting ATPase
MTAVLPETKHTGVTSAPAWHVLTAATAAQRLHVDPRAGLDPAEVEQRTTRYGTNELREQRRRGPARMLLDQFTDFMILVLIAAAIISGVVGDPPDAITIVIIVLLNGAIGFLQEYRAERAVAALKMMAAPSATVRRAGQLQSVPATALVPGDIVLLEAGNVIPADLRLIESAQLKIDEAALTGESVPTDKIAAPLDDPEVPLGDRHNLAYKGTLVTYGRGAGMVVATGMETELGKIATLLSDTADRKTPLQKRLAQFGQRLALAAIGVCIIVFAVGLLRGESVVLMFLTAVSLAVAAIPEALPAVVTVSLALGARRMVRHHALIRRLPAVETLGSVTYICSDKTGTLTQNQMQVVQLLLGAELVPPHEAGSDSQLYGLFHTALALNNDALVDNQDAVRGDPTEIALYVAAAAAGSRRETIEATAPRLAEIPFDADRKRMTTLHRHGGETLAFTKGAPESVLPVCTRALGVAGSGPLERARVLARAEAMAAHGLRVLALAYRTWPEMPHDLSPLAVEEELSFLGLIGLIDPPRPEARTAVGECQSAGITPVMITGDHPATARAIAAQLGIIEDGGEVLTGQRLHALSMAEFEERVEHIRVYARVAPAQKIKIVKALQDRGEFVAMTGDGVNDAPALKQADIGVAMGVTGTDVARETAHMILLDDNFATIVAAVREGRRIFDNTRKFIRYAVTCNSGEIWTIFLAPFLGLPIPLLPIHILWINLVTDGLPGVALAAEPHEPDIMRRPPRPPAESIFAHGLWQHILWVGLLMGGTSLLTQAWAYHTGMAHWQTMVFTVLSLSQMGHVLAIRSETQSLFRRGLWTNAPLMGAVLLTTVLQLLTVYLPPARAIFKTEALSAAEVTLCLALSAVVFVAVEIEKALVRHGRLYRNGPCPRPATEPPCARDEGRRRERS